MIHSWPRAIIHIDGDSFFASCVQSVYPHLRGKPVVTGSERGVVTAASTEAKQLGISRQTSIHDIKRLFPQCVIVSSNYELYELISYKMFEIIKRWTPLVEQYSVDEWFADITGFRRVYHCPYSEIAGQIKNELEQSLHLSISVGISVNKSLAKLASNYQKPSGLTNIPGKDIRTFLQSIPIGDVWGIGPNTAHLLQNHHIQTAYDFAIKPEEFVKKILSKPGYEIWQELQGQYIFTVNPQEKDGQQSISKIRTFPPTTEKVFLWGQLVHNLETVCQKARFFNLVSQKIGMYLKGQDFKMYGVEIKLTHSTNYPLGIAALLKIEFDKLVVPKKLYRATYIVLHDLQSPVQKQYSLFDNIAKTEKISAVFRTVDELSEKYGRGVVQMGSTIV